MGIAVVGISVMVLGNTPDTGVVHMWWMLPITLQMFWLALHCRICLDHISVLGPQGVDLVLQCWVCVG